MTIVLTYVTPQLEPGLVKQTNEQLHAIPSNLHNHDLIRDKVFTKYVGQQVGYIPVISFEFRQCNLLILDKNSYHFEKKLLNSSNSFNRLKFLSTSRSILPFPELLCHNFFIMAENIILYIYTCMLAAAATFTGARAAPTANSASALPPCHVVIPFAAPLVALR